MTPSLERKGSPASGLNAKSKAHDMLPDRRHSDVTRWPASGADRMEQLDDFGAKLRDACGAFALLGARGRNAVGGKVFGESKAGIRLVEICSNLQQFSRSRREISLGGHDDLFLILQEDGNALISQHEASHWLQPGDLALIDSMEPSEFTFFGEFSRQRFALLPRASLLARLPNGKVVGGNFLPAADPANAAISAVLQKIRLLVDPDPEIGAFLGDALLALVRVMACEAPRSQQACKGKEASGTDHALSMSRQYIDNGYQDSNFKIREMAETLRLSMRQVQRSFAALETTPTKYLLIKRLEHARKEIDQMIAGRRSDLISTIAFEAGFSDLSYFQRTFRRAFGNTPREYIRGIAG